MALNCLVRESISSYEGSTVLAIFPGFSVERAPPKGPRPKCLFATRKQVQRTTPHQANLESGVRKTMLIGIFLIRALIAMTWSFLDPKWLTGLAT